MSYPNDCLVLKIEEYDQDDHKLDTQLFILFDSLRMQYIIRGKRRDSKSSGVSKDYSFTSNSAFDLMTFINYSLCPMNVYSYSLYNYDNLPYESNEITFEFLDKWVSPQYEIVGYDNIKRLSVRQLSKMLRMLKNVSNEY